MRLIVDRALFDPASSEEALALSDLFITVQRGASKLQQVPPFHALLTDPLYKPAGDNGPLDRWLAARPPSERDAFRTVLRAGALTDSRRSHGGQLSDSRSPRRWHLEGWLSVRVERRPESDWTARRLTAVDAAELLHEPVHLVLENGRTDLDFVCLLAGTTNGDVLRKRKEQAAGFSISSGGGGEVKKWLEELINSRPSPSLWRRMLRAWVLFDQDTSERDAREPSKNALEIMNACEKVVTTHGRGLSWICLRRREIESYVPDEGLLKEALQHQQPFVRKVIAWRADADRKTWAWALDLKKGLRGDLRGDLPQSTRDGLKKQPPDRIALTAGMLRPPFDGLEPDELTLMESGLSDRLANAIRAVPARAWATNLPAEYDRGPVDQAPRLAFVQSLLDRV